MQWKQASRLTPAPTDAIARAREEAEEIPRGEVLAKAGANDRDQAVEAHAEVEGWGRREDALAGREPEHRSSARTTRTSQRLSTSTFIWV
jgi:hypothetical protein